jgi:predicted homoserine dehydrogenase-like protein
MVLRAAGDIDKEKIKETRELIPDSCFDVRDCSDIPSSDDIDIFMEASSSVEKGLEYTKQAIESKHHVILMNGEVDCFYGPELYEMAKQAGVIFSSTDGDQYGVLIKLIEEVELMGLRTIMIGNIKGFLDRHATPKSIEYEAKIRNLDPQMCVTYTDGTKLAVEMAIMSNATGFVPYNDRMEGPKMKDVQEVLRYYNFDKIRENPCVEYILGAEPGGGVFIVAECHHAYQRDLLKYYKMGGGPYYLFYRPYHLCHLETAYATGRVWFDRVPLLAPWNGRIANIYAVSKKDLEPGDVLDELGQFTVYGEIALQSRIDDKNWLLAHEAAGKKMKTAIKKDTPICLDHVE